MSNELESDVAMVMNLESFGIDGVGYDETETDPPSSTNPLAKSKHAEAVKPRALADSSH